MGGWGAGLKMGLSTTKQAEDMDCEHSTQKHNTICEDNNLRCNMAVRWLVFLLFLWYILDLSLEPKTVTEVSVGLHYSFIKILSVHQKR
jgi:hypothetical protein